MISRGVSRYVVVRCIIVCHSVSQCITVYHSVSQCIMACRGMTHWIVSNINWLRCRHSDADGGVRSGGQLRRLDPRPAAGCRGRGAEPRRRPTPPVRQRNLLQWVRPSRTAPYPPCPPTPRDRWTKTPLPPNLHRPVFLQVCELVFYDRRSSIADCLLL